MEKKIRKFSRADCKNYICTINLKDATTAHINIY